MDSNYYLILCLKLIEEKIDQGSSNDWTHKTFISLSDAISQKTNIYISISSLKRLYGKVKYESSPQKDTLNALAKYLDYENWNDFQQKNNPELPTSSHAPILNGQSKTKTKTKKKRLIFGIAIIISILSISYLLTTSSSDNFEDIVFSLKALEGEVPFNLVVHYDISMLKDDQKVYIDFDDFTTSDNKMKELLPKNNNTITHTYLYGDLYRIKLYVGDSLLREIPALVTTKGWQNVLALYTDNKYYSLSDKDSGLFENKLFIRPSLVESNGVDTIRDYWLKNRWVAPLTANADNFIYETKIRDTYNPGGNNCPEVDMTVLSEFGSFKFKIFNSGCGSLQTKHQFGNITIDGKYFDLSAFGKELKNWHKIRMEVRNKKVAIYCDEQKIYDTTYTVSAGKLYGILYGSKRSAEIDFVRILNLNGEPIFVDEFTIKTKKNLNSLQ